jgi:hypothetical protein
MEASIQRVFTREEKQKILSFTLDNLGKAAFKGLILGGATSFVLRSRTLGVFVFSYMLGNSLRESNDYIFNNFKP